MPQINRIRVNNVKYNFGTQFYDDFVMRFSCKNTIYDLANGGGKSVLMLLLLQNLIPNCTLDEKQPVEKLFRTGDGSSTIHSLVEWKLDEENIKNNFKYMLTGFCARKARDEENNENIHNTAIEYFNYCIFYREFNDNDLKNLPLTKGRERITYTGLKNYLKELEKKDYSLIVKIFDRKGEYQRFIAGYGLFESQWELIRGINRTEGHVRTYFETNYRTTKKVVEDLFIEEIIEKSFNSRTAVENDSREATGEAMAKTLLTIKDKLIELSAKKNDMGVYDRQTEAIESFIGRISGIRQLYFGREEMEEQIVRASNTLDRIMEKREAERIKYEESMALSVKEKNRLENLMAVIRVQGDESKMKSADRLIDEQSERLSALNKEHKEKKHMLLMLESENDYMDYIYYKGERDSIKAVIKKMTEGDSDSREIRRTLAAYGVERKKRNELKRAAIEECIQAEEAALKGEKDFLESLKEQENTYIQDISVADYMLSDWEKRLTEINKDIYKEKERLGMVIGGNSDAELSRLAGRQEKVSANIEDLQKRAVEYGAENSAIEYEYRDITEKIKKTEVDMEGCGLLKKEYDESLKKLEKIQKLYGEYGTDNLYRLIDERYRETIGQADRNRSGLKSLKLYAKNLENGCPVGESSELKEVLDYIEKYHGDVAVSGVSFISSLSSEERVAAINRIPLLPYCIVINSSYDKIVSDGGIRAILKGDYAIPLIRLEAVKREEYIFGMSDVAFVMRDESLFTDSKSIEREQIRATQKLRDMEERQRQLDEAVDILREDLDFVNEYNSIYKKKISDNDKEYRELRIKQKSLKNEMEILQDKRLALAKNIEKLSADEKSLKEEEELLREKADALKRLAEMDREEEELSKNINRVKSKGESLKKSYKDIREKIKGASGSISYRMERTDSLKKELAETEENWEKLYGHYWGEEEALSINDLDKMSDDEIDSKAKALNEILSGGAKDLNDKRRLMENYDIAMERSLDAIDYKGIPVNEIREGYREGRVRSHSKEELKALRNILDSGAEAIVRLEKELSKNKEIRARLEGAVNHGILVIKEKYGDFKRIFTEEEMETIDADSRLKESALRIGELSGNIMAIKDKLSHLDETGTEFIIYRRDLDKIIEKASISVDDREKAWEDNDDFVERLNALRERYERYEKEVINRREELEHEKITLYDTLREMSSFRLADEIRNNVVMPDSVRETEELMESLREITDCIRLEKDRIEKSIEDIERIKDSFENQCIQSCINIRTELERFPKLSKINMDGERISIIGLSVPYIPENMYKKQMSEYIDNIVETADNIKSEEERIRYIRGQLSFKKLFSVIVTDMNGIKLTLYKRERIREQSRYLRYEEAVGSTGQSQGIYIQFLIAIINYITSINSPGAGSKNAGKTIFIDNPFGAAKDVYIWEPIFKLLKTNNVQLIVPCRGATPAITGRFDVNYVLGQKMIDGKQQTVVVEYYSNVESDTLEYQRLSFEQSKIVFE